MKSSRIFKKIINRFTRFFKKKLKVALLLIKRYKSCKTSRIWILEQTSSIISLRNDRIKIFEKSIPYEDINWHKDYRSDYEYPLLRFDILKFHLLFNKGVDVIFPWETSRCQFLVALGQNYCATEDINYYYRFKTIIFNWISTNPYLYGVNWTSAMDVSIRAVNWIIACELFNEPFENDEELQNEISISLQQHLDYILRFRSKRGNNHLVSHYAGILFISMFIKNKKSERVQKISIKGLEHCMQSQVFDDGVDCEVSLCYHRLVLEMFAYTAIIAKSNNVEFSGGFYTSLFRMFEFVASYIDHDGHAPQIGDNDSGRFLILDDTDENDHSYILEIGAKIFNYSFRSQKKIIESDLSKWMPDFKSERANTTIRTTDKSIGFTEGGFYFLKNNYLNIAVTATEISKKTITGHKHFDFGSYTISYKGIPIIIDPGTYIYTPDINMRNRLRSMYSHNVPIPIDLNPEHYKSPDYFGLGGKWPIINNIKFNNDNQISFKINYEGTQIERTISIRGRTVYVIDESDSPFKSYLNTKIKLNSQGNKLLNKFVTIETNAENVILEKSYFSERYGHLSDEGIKIVFSDSSVIKTKFIFS